MRGESGVNLVTGALQSSLARAQQAYNFHGENSSYNSEDNKNQRKKLNVSHNLVSHCESIGSQFATLNVEQLQEYGRSLTFVDGGYLPPLITEELKSKYPVLRDDVGPPPGIEWLPTYPFKRSSKKSTDEKATPKDIFEDKITPLLINIAKRKDVRLEKNKLVNGFKSVGVGKINSPLKTKEKEKQNNYVVNASFSGSDANNTADNKSDSSKKFTEKESVSSVNKKTPVKKLNSTIEKLLKTIRDKNIGKNKRKRLIKKVKKLQKIQGNSETGESPKTVENQKPQVLKGNKLTTNNLVNLSSVKAVTDPKEKANLFKNKSNQKLTPLKKTMGPDSGKNSESVLTNGHSNNHQLPQPKKVLFPKEKIVLGWRQKRSPGVGFHNFGNTCYLNSSLQALFHVPAFVNWLQTEEEHRSLCNGFQSPCILCVVYTTLQEHSRSNCPIRPRVLDKLKAICKHFSYGRQEDAHEFLRYLLEGMERSYLTVINGLRLDNRTKETNPLGQIFGGYIRTEVTCLKCNSISTTFQPSSELQLDIRHITTLEDALQQHFRKERLDNNDYKCEKCRTISQATKQFSLEVPPLVLCLQLKRFTLYGNKISKRIHCNRLLNMSKYIHKSRRESVLSEQQELKYRLVALVTHMGQSPNCGHYTAIAEGSNGTYYQFDDQSVYQVSPQSALNNDAYVIIYEMDRGSRSSGSDNTSSVSSSTAFGSPMNNSSSGYSLLQKPATITSEGAAQKKFTIPFAKSNGNSTSTMSSPAPPTVPKQNGLSVVSNIDRKLLAFGMGRGALNSPTSSNGVSTPKKINFLKPGVTLTNTSKLLPPATTVITKNSNLKLVPYNDIDNDESDKEDQTPTESTPQKSEIIQKFIGPVFGPQLPATPPKSPKVSATVSSPRKSKSPEPALEIKKKISELSNPIKPLENTSSETQTPKKEPVVSTTSEWTITSTSKKRSNGYSSDPESKVSFKKVKTADFVRAKSVERVLQKSTTKQLNFVAPLVPNKKPTPVESDKVSEILGGKGKLTKDLIINKNQESEVVKTNGHHTPNPKSVKKRKRSRSNSSSSSSSSSSESDSKRRKKKHMKKKEKHKSKKKASSLGSESSSDDNSHHKRSRKKHKKKKHHHKTKDSVEEGTKQSKVKKDRSVSRETDSEERDKILRQARNPSRSPFRPEDTAKCNGQKAKFDPSKIDSRGKAIVSWNGQQSLLSKCIQQNNRQSEKTKEELLDEELDQGKTKKTKKSRSPSREEQSAVRFQSVQERKSAITHRTTVLEEFGFKSDKTQEREKSWETKNHDEPKFGPRSDGYSYPSSNGYRNNNNRRFGNNFRNPNADRNRNHHDKNRNWNNRNHR